MKKPTTNHAISTDRRKLTLARQTLRHLTPRELAGAAGADEVVLPPNYGQITQTCLTCASW
jgi:hypothetical protein